MAELHFSSLDELNSILLNQSYITDFSPSNADALLLKYLKVSPEDLGKYPNISRWLRHLQSFSQAELLSFRDESVKTISLKGISLVSECDQTSCAKTQSKQKPKAESQTGGKGKKAVAAEVGSAPIFILFGFELFC